MSGGRIVKNAILLFLLSLHFLSQSFAPEFVRFATTNACSRWYYEKFLPNQERLYGKNPQVMASTIIRLANVLAQHGRALQLQKKFAKKVAVQRVIKVSHKEIIDLLTLAKQNGYFINDSQKTLRVGQNDLLISGPIYKVWQQHQRNLCFNKIMHSLKNREKQFRA